MLPGPVLVMLRVLAWMMPHHLVLAVASPLIFRDDKGVLICCTLAIASVACALMLHMHDKMDERVAKGIAAHQRSEAEIARIAGAALEGGQMAAAPIRRTSGAFPALRSVPDYPAS